MVYRPDDMPKAPLNPARLVWDVALRKTLRQGQSTKPGSYRRGRLSGPLNIHPGLHSRGRGQQDKGLIVEGSRIIEHGSIAAHPGPVEAIGPPVGRLEAHQPSLDQRGVAFAPTPGRGETVDVGLSGLNPRPSKISDLRAVVVERFSEGTVGIHAQCRPQRQGIQLEPPAQLV